MIDERDPSRTLLTSEPIAAQISTRNDDDGENWLLKCSRKRCWICLVKAVDRFWTRSTQQRCYSSFQSNAFGSIDQQITILFAPITIHSMESEKSLSRKLEYEPPEREFNRDYSGVRSNRTLSCN